MFKEGQKVIVKGVPFDFKRIDCKGVIVGLAPYESCYYRVKVGNQIKIVSDSMLELDSEA